MRRNKDESETAFLDRLHTIALMIMGAPGMKLILSFLYITNLSSNRKVSQFISRGMAEGPIDLMSMDGQAKFFEEFSKEKFRK